MSILKMRGRYRPLPISSSPLLRQALPDWRLRFVSRLLMVMFAAVLGMAFYLQIIRQSDLQARGEEFSDHSQTLPAFRGMILDRHGNLLAGSLMTRTIVADPLQIKRELAIRRLVGLIGYDARQLERRLHRKAPFEIKLTTPLTPEVRQGILQLGIAGIYPESTDTLRIEPENFKAEAAQLDLAREPVIQELAELLEMETGKLVATLEKGIHNGRRGIELRHQVRESRAARIADLKLAGLSQSGDFKRYYPMGKISAHLVGFTGVGDSGQEGAESVFDGDLSGTPGVWNTIRDRKGRLIEERSMTYAANGQDIRLSLDSRIQYLTFTALQQAIAAHQAKAGSALVLDAQSGEVLALANLPSFDPNDRRNLFGDKLRNRGVVFSYELGSVMKPFTVALGLEKGIVHPDTPLDCSPGSFTVAGEPIPDHSNHFRVLSVAQVLQKSSNIGAARIGMAVTRQEMGENLAAFGFGEKPGLGFPSESAGQVRSWKQWQSRDQARISYGYSFAASPLQLARAYLAFTRKERNLVPLSMLALDGPPEGGKPIISERTRRDMLDMLESVVNAPGATGWRAKVPGYRIGGKTGTAQKLVNGRYDRTRHLASFVGIAPMSAPRLIVVVSIDEPGIGGYGGGAVAAPIVSQIAAGALRSLGIAPDMPLQLAKAATGEGSGGRQ
ncbi:MAG: penicillin-binding protein 2 [Zoogloeaceae bacterium]|jgi:cell division protein FtsI (penicillin-binding protein 3)|nr:penicillin-binding protein 2 [Zoogloeaceae bacterium]